MFVHQSPRKKTSLNFASTNKCFSSKKFLCHFRIHSINIIEDFNFYFNKQNKENFTDAIKVERKKIHTYANRSLNMHKLHEIISDTFMRIMPINLE